MEDVDKCYVWERRIHHGIRHQKRVPPFPESVAIGLEFNAALERKEKLNPCLLTNAVMLELCDFAKTVTKSEKYFLFDMLEFNFDIGMDVNNDKDCYEYATRVQNKIRILKEQMKLKPQRWMERFPLPDPGVIKALEPGRYFTKRNRIADVSVLTGGSKNRPEKLTCERAASSSFVLKRKGGLQLKPTSEVYPFCRNLGVSLTVKPDTPKKKLDPSLVTIGIMIELLDFSRAMCGAHTHIVNELVLQNFGQALDKLQFRLQVNKLTERKYTCGTVEDREAFRTETFQLQNKRPEQKLKKRKRCDADLPELEKLTSKRRESLRHMDGEEMCLDSELSYMCPVDFETDVQTESLSDIKQEDQGVFIFQTQPENGHPAARCHKQFEHSDLFSEDKIGDTSEKAPKQRLWMRRTPRSKQIVRLSRVNDLFAHSREIGLDFNVGVGKNHSLDLQLLTNWVLLEVFKFATALRKSLRSFLFDILGNNFSLPFQDDLHPHNLIFYIMSKGKKLQNHPARQKHKFLSRPFKFPEIYNIVDVTSDFETEQGFESVLSSAPSQQAQEEPYPFCKKLGLNLWSTEEYPQSQKLDLTVLTVGAVLEVFHFIRQLCGSVRETVNDILEHNFDLDLQSGASEASKVIQRWYIMQKSLMKKQNMSPKISKWLNMVIPLKGHSDPELDDFQPGSETSNIKLDSYDICAKIGLDLDISPKLERKNKLDLQLLTRAVLLEVHWYVKKNCNRYVPALYEILEYNFDLSSQKYRKVELAWSVASQVIAIVGKHNRTGGYLNTVFELPMEASAPPLVACKDEPEDSFNEPDLGDDDDIVFVRKLKAVDIEVEIE